MPWPKRFRRHYRALTAAICVIGGATASGLAGIDGVADGLLLDGAVKARALAFPGGGADGEPMVAVVALDERTLDGQPLPRALLAPVWAETLNALFEAGASVVAFDFILAYHAGRFRTDWDKGFKRQLYRHRSRIVLGRTGKAWPAAEYVTLLSRRPAGKVGFLEVAADADGVLRWVDTRIAPAGKGAGEEPILMFSGAILAQAGRAGFPDRVLLAPRRHLETLPTYALIDVLDCARSAPEVLRSEFASKVVLVGSTLPDEDRLFTSGRFLPPVTRPGEPHQPCALRRLGASNPDSRRVPGVHAHAAVVDTVLRDRQVRMPGAPTTAMLAALFAAIGSVAGLFLAPWYAMLVLLGLGVAGFAGVVALLEAGIWLPLALPVLALGGSIPVAYVSRYVAEERDKGLIRDAFGSYLAPEVVKRIMEDGGQPTRGGEMRHLTVWISDIANYSTISEQSSPGELAAMLNQVFSVMADTVEEFGGYVTQYAGDAMVAVFGAFADDQDHGPGGVRAALAAHRRVAELAEARARAGKPAMAVRIGISSDDMLVGNIGSEQRLNYAVVGDGINLSARLEGANKLFDTSILVSQSTRALCPPTMLFRKVDRLRVKGRETPLDVFEPLGLAEDVAPETKERITAFEAALDRYRSRDFAGALKAFRALADEDPVARTFVERARAFAEKAPDESWDGVNTLTTK